jgi:hypothetical protein
MITPFTRQKHRSGLVHVKFFTSALAKFAEEALWP